MSRSHSSLHTQHLLVPGRGNSGSRVRDLPPVQTAGGCPVDSSSTPGRESERRGGRGRGEQGGDFLIFGEQLFNREQLFSRKGAKLGFGRTPDVALNQICFTFFSNSLASFPGSESPGQSYSKPASKGTRNSYQHTIGC